MNRLPIFKTVSIFLLWSFLILFTFLPLLFVLIVSFLQHDLLHLIKLPFTLQNYLAAFNPAYAKVLLNSFEMSFSTTLCCLIIGYPFAFFIARIKKTDTTYFIIIFCDHSILDQLFNSHLCHDGNFKIQRHY